MDFGWSLVLKRVEDKREWFVEAIVGFFVWV